MRTTWKLVVLAIVLLGLRYLLLPDLAHFLPQRWPPLRAALRVELPLFLILYLTLRVDTGVALTTAFWTGLLADTLLLGTVGLRALIFLIVAIVPDLLRKYLLVEGAVPSWVFLLLGLFLSAFLAPIVEPGATGLLDLLPTAAFWNDLGVYALVNSLCLFPALFLLDSLCRGFKITSGGESP